MFSGIVEELGVVKRVSRAGNITLLEILAFKITEGLNTGDSVAVNGVCLTVTGVKDGVISFDLLAETAKSTNLGSIKTRDKANLERSLRLGERLSGHFVSGHIDCTGVIRRKFTREGNLCFEVAIPQADIKYCLPKGSVAIDGISLTIASIRSNLISVYIIPHTLKNTTLSFKGPSDKVNIEFDMLVKARANF